MRISVAEALGYMASADNLNLSTAPLTTTSETNPDKVDLVDFGTLDTEPSIAVQSAMFDDLDASGDDAISGSLEESVSTSESNNECKMCK